MARTFVIDFFEESVQNYRRAYAVVVIDVIRATTTAITAVSTGRRCYVAASLDAAYALALRLPNPLLLGELGGVKPFGFDMNNSPVELLKHPDLLRPVVLLSSSGTKLMDEAGRCDTRYVACFRNHSATAVHLLRGNYPRIALIGAGSRGEVREEDVICCAWIADRLMEAGYEPHDARTAEILSRWSGSNPSDCLSSKSLTYLKTSGQFADVHFILGHIDDLDAAFALEGGEVVMVTQPVPRLEAGIAL